MDTNKKLPLKKNIPLPPKKSLKNSTLSKINTPLPTKKIKLPNLHDLERFHKNCTYSLSTLIFRLYEKLKKSAKLNKNTFLLPLSLHCTAKVLFTSVIGFPYFSLFR